MTMTELRRVMVVDDAPDIRLVARLALEKVGGLEVVLCESGAAAVAALPEFKPDIVLLDVMMPGWDGPTTLAELRKHPEGAGLPCVFFTARQEAGEVERLMALGPIGLIAKPFDAMKLASELRAIWSRRDPV